MTRVRLLERPIAMTSGIAQMFQYAETRGLRDKLGRSIVKQVAVMQKRIARRGEVSYINVVDVDVYCPYFGCPTRHYSGISHMAKVPEYAVAKHLERELLAGAFFKNT